MKRSLFARVLAPLLGLAAMFAVLVPSVAVASVPTAAAQYGALLQKVAEGVGDEVYGQPIVEVRFEGNRRVESEAMLLELDSNVGELVSQRKLASDLKRLWALGYFEDVRVEGELLARGVVLTYVVVERPSVRKIIVEGNDEIKLDDINEELDLEKNEVLDLGKVTENIEKIKALYTASGFFLAEVSYELRPVPDEPGKVDVAIVITESTEVIAGQVMFGKWKTKLSELLF